MRTKRSMSRPSWNLACWLLWREENRSAPEEGLYCKPKYRANLFKYILLVLAILFFVSSAVRISLPSVFCILDILLIQVYKRSGTTHRFVAVVLQILIVLKPENLIRSPKKRKALLMWLKEWKYDIIFLQETYSTDEVKTFGEHNGKVSCSFRMAPIIVVGNDSSTKRLRIQFKNYSSG